MLPLKQIGIAARSVDADNTSVSLSALRNEVGAVREIMFAT